jgi:hypothetical protein
MTWIKYAVFAVKPWMKKTFPDAVSAAGVFTWLGQPEPTSRNAAPTSFILRVAA